MVGGIAQLRRERRVRELRVSVNSAGRAPSTEHGQAREVQAAALGGGIAQLLLRSRSPRNSVVQSGKHPLVLPESAALSRDLVGLTEGLALSCGTVRAPQLTSNGPSDMFAGPLAVG